MSTDASDTRDIAVSHAQQAAAGAQDRAADVAAHAQDAAHDVAGTVGEQANQVKDETVRQVRNLTGEATSQLSSQAQEQTQRLSGLLRELGDELSGMAHGGQPGGTATELVHQAADRVHGLAGYLDGQEPQQILDDARAFARSRPGAFLAGAAVLGLLVGRVGRGVKDAGSDSDTAASDAEAISRVPDAVSATDPYPAAGVSEFPVGGFSSSTETFTTQDPITGAWVHDPDGTLEDRFEDGAQL